MLELLSEASMRENKYVSIGKHPSAVRGDRWGYTRLVGRQTQGRERLLLLFEVLILASVFSRYLYLLHPISSYSSS